MANEIDEKSRCERCRHYGYTGTEKAGYCRRQKMATTPKSACKDFRRKEA